MAACLAVYDDAEDARNINIWAAEPMRSLTLDSTELLSARLLASWEYGEEHLRVL